MCYIFSKSLYYYFRYIIVVANPDGYAYSHNRDRMWRKNRSLHSGQTCYGTDLNRNFPIGWGTTGGENSFLIKIINLIIRFIKSMLLNLRRTSCFF